MPALSHLLLGLLLAACGPEADTGTDGTPEAEAPNLAIEPATIVFEDTPPGAHAVAPLVLRNDGDGVLHLTPMDVVEPGSPFAIEPMDLMFLEPGEVAAAVLDFDPVAVGGFQGTLRIQSDDPDAPILDVPLTGTGLGGALVLTAESADLGLVEVGCEGSTSLSVSNAGNADLTVADWSLAGSSDEWIFTAEAEAGPLPWGLAPGEVVTLGQLDYRPLDAGEDSVLVTVDSDDPLTPVGEVSVVGVGDYQNLVEQKIQIMATQVDALLVVNGSSAMHDELIALIDAIPAFQNALAASAESYQYAGITQAHCVAGPVRYIDSSFTPDRAKSAFQVMISSASQLPRVVEMLNIAVYHVVRPAECNTGTLRDGYHWSLVGITDEADTSPEDPAWYIDSMLTKKGDLNFSFHGIAGPEPTGCSGADAWGMGNDLAGLTGGTSLSICTTDWDATMTQLARDLAENAEWKDSYKLDEEPVEGTISITANGVPFEGVWSYDARANAVEFDTFPSWDADIRVTYAVPGECE